MSVLSEQKYVWCRNCDAVLFMDPKATECHCGTVFGGTMAEWRAPCAVDLTTDALALRSPREAHLNETSRRKDAEHSPQKRVARRAVPSRGGYE